MGKLFTFNIAFFACLGSFLFGYDSGVMTDVIASKHFLGYFDTTSDSPILGAIVSTFAGGAVFGALSGGYTMDRLGRRVSIQIGAVVCVVGAILQAASTHLAMMLVGRIITGWAVGIMSSAVPVYCAELAHPKRRGFLVGLSQQMIGLGFIVSTWVGYGSAHASDSSSFQWRFPLAFQGVPAGILALGLIWFPESPRQLIEKDNEEEALRILKKLHANGRNDEWIMSVLVSIPEWNFLIVFCCSSCLYTLADVINYYQTQMYEALGITGKKALLVSGLYNIVGPVTNAFFIFFLIDRVGRRKPLLFGTIGISLCLIVEAILNSKNPDGENESLSRAGVAMIFLVSMVFSVSFGPISWTYMSEVMPMQIRGNGNAFAAGIGNWLVNVLFSQVSPQALAKLKWKYYFVFVAFNFVVTLPTVFFVFKETKGVSLEEIDLLFGERALGSLPNDIEKEQNVHIEHDGKRDTTA